MKDTSGVSMREENQNYGKWNGIFSTNGRELYVFRVNSTKLYPESISEYRQGMSNVIETGEFSPVRVDTDLTNACNNDCIMCFSKGLRKRSVSIPLRRAITMYDDFSAMGAKSIRLTGGGDFLTYPDKDEILEHLSSLGYKITIETNGDLLDEDDMHIPKYVHHLRVSVDSGDNESRIAVHRPNSTANDYDALLGKIRRIREVADDMGRKDELFIGATFVVLPENYQHVERFISDMYALGINWVAIRKSINRKIYRCNPGILQYIDDVFSSLPEFERDFTVVGQYGVSFNPSESFDMCWVSYLRGIVLADSTLHLCCLARNRLMSKARVGRFIDGNNPIHSLLEKRKKRVDEFRSSAPEECPLCIDTENNIAFGHMARLLTNDPSAEFRKAVVIESEKTNITERQHIIEVGLKKDKYAEFEGWGLTRLE